MNLSDKVCQALCAQMGKELVACNTYLTAAAWMDNYGLRGMHDYLRGHALEEHGHSMKIFDFIVTRKELPVFGPLPALSTKGWNSPVDVWKAILAHEEMISKSILELYELADSEGDEATCVFLQWFISEQVEEEDKASTILARVTMAGTNSAALLTLDSDIGV